MRQGKKRSALSKKQRGRITGLPDTSQVPPATERLAEPAMSAPPPKGWNHFPGPSVGFEVHPVILMKTTTNPTHEEIARQAQRLWQERGCPEDKNEEIWLEAEDQLTNHPFDGESPSPATSAERIKAETAAESMVEYQITPAVTQQEAIKAALQKKDTREAKPPRQAARKAKPSGPGTPERPERDHAA
jgi:hypothetical protein